MSEFTTHNQDENIANVDTSLLFKVLFLNKIKIIILGLLFGISAVFYSLALPNVYQSEALLAPVENDSNNLSNSLKSLGGIASFAGLAMPSQSTKTNTGIQILKSYAFFTRFINRVNGLPELMASKSWDKNNDVIIYSPEFDNIERKWMQDAKPSLQEAYKKFNSSFGVLLDQKTGMVKLSFKHHSPNLSKEWLEEIISLINTDFKNRDVASANRSIDFLDQQINNTNISEIKIVISDLIQSQIQTVMLAESTPEYLFQMIDPPIAPEIKIEPKRAIICITAAILGSFLGSLYSLILYMRSERKNKAILVD